MSQFPKFITRIIGHEGGYTADPQDSGNWTGGVIGKGQLKGTKFGIAANTYGDLDIKNLTQEQAIAIYERDFWRKPKLDQLPPAVGFQVLDASINHGGRRAVQFLQRAVGVLDDGVLGPKTIAAVAAADPAKVINSLMAQRTLLYQQHPKFDRYGKGWLARLEQNKKYAKEDLARADFSQVTSSVDSTAQRVDTSNKVN